MTLGDVRRAHGLSLEDVVAATRLSSRHARAIDDGRYDALPPGLYARAYIRSFGAAVSADAETVHAALALLPCHEVTLESIGEARSRAQAPRPDHRLPRAFFITVASVTDAAVLLLATGALVSLGAATSGVSAREFIESAPAPLLFVCATIWLQYFVLFAGVHGRTAGEALCGLRRRHASAALRLTTVCQRLMTPAPVPAPLPSEAPAVPC